MTESKAYPYKDGETTVLGAELFAAADDTVIFWKGANYYKACGAKVADLHDGGMTTCVKHVKHPDKRHEDFDGRIYHEIHGFDPQFLEVPTPCLWPDDAPVTQDMIRRAWDLYVKPTQDAGEMQSEELRAVMACLRTLNEVLPMDDVSLAKAKLNAELVDLDEDLVPTVVIDEVDGNCEKCGTNLWKTARVNEASVLMCQQCGNHRIDR